jgi:hypothetical protein
MFLVLSMLVVFLTAFITGKFWIVNLLFDKLLFLMIHNLPAVSTQMIFQK